MRKRALLAAIVAALLIAAMPAASLAGKPVRVSDTQTSVGCALTNADGTAFVELAASAQFGTFAIVGFWPVGTAPFAEPPAWVGEATTVDLSADGTQVTAAFDVYEFDLSADPPFGDLVGVATLDAVLSPAGPAEPFEESFRDGNRQVRRSGTVQPLAVSGTLTLPEDIVYDDLSSCFAVASSFTSFETNPNSYVTASDQVFVSCFWEDAESFIGFDVFSDNIGTFANVFVQDASGMHFGGSETATLTSTLLEAEMPLFSDLSGDLSGSASASAAVTVGDRFNFMGHFGNEKFKAIGQQLHVDGTLELETPMGVRSLPMNDETCFGQDARTRSIITNPNPGKGPKLTNDALGGALPLAIGQTVSVRTGGTVEPPEATCIVSSPDGDNEIPLGHTVWYAVEGTGGAVTIDTAGSDYDTVIGVYTTDGVTLTQVGCGDDVFEEPDFFSLQARITVETVAGETYYVQAGGFGGSSGRLTLAAY